MNRRTPRTGANARPKRMPATIRAAVGRDAPITPNPAPPPTPAGGRGFALPPVGADSISARFAAARGPAADRESATLRYNKPL